MKGKPHVWIAAVTAGAVVGIAVVDMGRKSPGPLTAVHGREPDLASGSCGECHGGWTSSMTESCLECHAAVEAHIDSGQGLHGVLLPEQANRCALCHSEHHGASFAIVNRQSFAEAGIPDPEAFPHARVGFSMEGKHLELDCAECHANADVDVLPRDEHRFLGLDQDCATCHEDPHEGRMGFSCTHCHGQESFEELSSRDHDQYLSLLGGHATSACRDCHAEGDAHALELLGGRGRPADRACMDCHESPHTGSFLDGIARLYSMPAEAACVVCHESEHVSFQDELLDVTAAQHASSGFRLNEPHHQTACADCHAPESTFEERYPGRAADTCASCHEDPHGGQFEEGPFASGCLSCHTRQAFEPHAFTVEEHARTRFALTGTHVDSECSSCHLDPMQGNPRRFHGLDGGCATCHTDAHAGFFLGRSAEAAQDALTQDLPNSVEARDCATCHVTTTFRDEVADTFEHERWTGFKIQGAHAQSACEACHPRADHPDPFGRSFGRVRDAFGEYGGCSTCHADPHLGGFDSVLLPQEVEGRTDCARCHMESSFRAFPSGFAHEQWTGFSLNGVHGEISCSACHPALRRSDEHGRTWKAAAGDNCSDCHADSHAGQFDVGRLETDCARCHASSISFSDLSFDHEKDSDFPLGEAHSGLDCGACHLPAEEADGSLVVRYRPLGKDCADCHGVQESILRKKRGR